MLAQHNEHSELTNAFISCNQFNNNNYNHEIIVSTDHILWQTLNDLISFTVDRSHEHIRTMCVDWIEMSISARPAKWDISKFIANHPCDYSALFISVWFKIPSRTDSPHSTHHWRNVSTAVLSTLILCIYIYIYAFVVTNIIPSLGFRLFFFLLSVFMLWTSRCCNI